MIGEISPFPGINGCKKGDRRGSPLQININNVRYKKGGGGEPPLRFLKKINDVGEPLCACLPVGRHRGAPSISKSLDPLLRVW